VGYNSVAEGKPLEFLDETYPAKGIGLPYGENFTILTSTVFLWSTHLTSDRQKDGRAIAYTRYSIYAVARKNCTTG